MKNTLKLAAIVALMGCSNALAGSFAESVRPFNELSEENKAQILAEMGEVSESGTIKPGVESPLGEARDSIKLRKPKPWDYAFRIAYIPEPEAGVTVGSVVSANTIKPALFENMKSVTIRMDGIWVADFPGWGKNKNRQFTFEASNKLKDGGSEDVVYNKASPVYEGQGAGIAGVPILRDLNISEKGLNVEITITNLKTDEQIKALGIMDSKAFNSGLGLLTTAQPALVPFTELARGIAKMGAEKDNGLVVGGIKLGLDFQGVVAGNGGRLNKGTYVAIQAPLEFDFSDLSVDFRNNSHITRKSTGKSLHSEYNYVIFRIE